MDVENITVLKIQLAPNVRGDGNLSSLANALSDYIEYEVEVTPFPSLAGGDFLLALAADLTYWKMLLPWAIDVAQNLPTDLLKGAAGAAGGQIFSYFLPSKHQKSIDEVKQILVDTAAENRDLKEENIQLKKLSEKLSSIIDDVKTTARSHDYMRLDDYIFSLQRVDVINFHNSAPEVTVERGAINKDVMALVVCIINECGRPSPDTKLINTLREILEKLQSAAVKEHRVAEGLD